MAQCPVKYAPASEFKKEEKMLTEFKPIPATNFEYTKDHIRGILLPEEGRNHKDKPPSESFFYSCNA